MRTWPSARLYRRPLARDDTAAGRRYRAARRAGFPVVTIVGETPFTITAGAGAWRTFVLTADASAVAATTAALARLEEDRHA
jgi:hypothetical protein